ncbi:MAG: metallophosphoesterase [Planctomycetota bacterium]
MRIVLFGDLHFYRLWLPPWKLVSKRILGQTNLILNRRKHFRHALLPGMIQKAIALKPDMLLLSGDVSTTSLVPEFADTAAALKPLADHVPTVLVPGNHDRYTFSAKRTRLIDRLLSGWVPKRFPHTQELTERWRLLALDAAVPRVYNARGQLGEGQFEAAKAYVESLDASEGLVVLCHYPCALPKRVHEHNSHALQERDALRQLFEQCRARVVYLHGHIHKPWHHEPGDGSGVPFTCIDAGSPCMVSDTFPNGQGFYEIELPDDPFEALDVRNHC